MRVVIQCVKSSNVIIDNKINGQIDKGYTILVGFTHDDTKEIIDKMITKIINLRVFTDENDKLNLSINDVNGSILSISQFTLYADTKKSRRPSFSNALEYNKASEYYDYFNEELAKHVHVEKGIFGADMTVNIENDGPCTIIIDSKTDL